MSVGVVRAEGSHGPSDLMMKAVDGQLRAIAHRRHGFPCVPGVAEEFLSIARHQAIGFGGNRPRTSREDKQEGRGQQRGQAR